jgi:hypothetical protein
LGTSARSSLPEVSVLQSQRLGNYDVTVLRPRDAQALSSWLTAASLAPLTRPATTAVDNYIARKWCFLVARLDHDGDEPATPHPIVATFPAAAPVYPMKLTGVSGSATRVELFGVADRQLVANGFACISADRYTREAGRSWTPYDDGLAIVESPFYEAAHTGLAIGSPEIGNLLWDYCIVTRLAADLTPEQMTQDVELGVRELTPHRDHELSKRASIEIAVTIFICGLIVLTWWTGISSARTGQPGRVNRMLAAAILIPTLVIAVVAYRLVPTIPVVAGRTIWHVDVHHRMQVAAECAHDGIFDSNTTVSQLSSLARFIKGRWANDENPLTGKPRTYERLPGEYTIRKTDGKTLFCAYDMDGREYSLELPPPKSRPTTLTATTMPAAASASLQMR